MSRGNPRQFSVTGAGSTLAGNTETAVVALTGVSTDGNSQIVNGVVSIPVTPGSDVAVTAIAVYRGPIGGTPVDAIQPASVDLTGVESKASWITATFRDQPGEVANMTYTVTLKTTSAAQNSTIGAPIVAVIVQ